MPILYIIVSTRTRAILFSTTDLVAACTAVHNMTMLIRKGENIDIMWYTLNLGNPSIELGFGVAGF